MNIWNGEQGSQEWLEARMGRITASGMAKIITPTGKPSSSIDGYIAELLVEWQAGEPQETFRSELMERGNELEPEARSWYEMATDTEVEQVGLVYLDDQELIACSPDGLPGLEIKCPSAAVHVGYLLGGEMPSKYIPQVQCCMWVCGKDSWDFLSYHPNFPPLLKTIKRDDKYIETMAALAGKAKEKLLFGRELLAGIAA